MFKKFFAVAVGFVSSLFAMSAHAEIPTAVGTAMTAVLTDATSLQTIVIPIVVGVLGLTLVITLIKRFGSKI